MTENVAENIEESIAENVAENIEESIAENIQENIGESIAESTGTPPAKPTTPYILSTTTGLRK
jgi:hypothetical protein